MISDAKKRRFLSVKASLSNHGGHSGSLETMAESMASRLKCSRAETGMTSAPGILLPVVQQGDHLFLVAYVYLVDRHDYRTLYSRQPLDIVFVLVGGLDGVRHVEYDVGIAYGPVHELHHVLLQTVVGLEYARGVGIDYLPVLSVDYPHNPVPGGLRLGSHDGELLAHQRVHQRRLPDVRIAYDINES